MHTIKLLKDILELFTTARRHRDAWMLSEGVTTKMDEGDEDAESELTHCDGYFKIYLT